MYGTENTTRWERADGTEVTGRGHTVQRLEGRRAALEPGLGLGDVNLNAVGALAGRVLAEGGGPLGGQEASAGFLALSVRQVQRLLSRDGELPLRGLLWYRRGDLSFFLKSITSVTQSVRGSPPAHEGVGALQRRLRATGGDRTGPTHSRWGHLSLPSSAGRLQVRNELCADTTPPAPRISSHLPVAKHLANTHNSKFLRVPGILEGTTGHPCHMPPSFQHTPDSEEFMKTVSRGCPREPETNVATTGLNPLHITCVMISHLLGKRCRRFLILRSCSQLSHTQIQVCPFQKGKSRSSAARHT